MTCSDYELHIALHIEGDLPPGDVPALERHLAGCPACRSFAAELRESQAEFKSLGVQELDAAFVAQVRESVRREVERRNARRFVLWRLFGLAGWRYAFAALTLALVATTTWYVVRPVPIATAPETAVLKSEPLPDRRLEALSVPTTAHRNVRHRVRSSPAMRAAVKPAAVNVDPRIGCQPFAPPPDTVPQQPIAPRSKETMRVEIQTKNPDVRIIWIAQSGASSQVEEKPSPTQVGAIQ